MYSRVVSNEQLNQYIRVTNVHTPLELHTKYLTMCIALATPDYTCLRPPGAAGAVLAGADYVLLGCVEPPIGPSCRAIGSCEMEDGHCVRNIHAEVNAILLAARYGYVTHDSYMYSILKPCYQCTKVMIRAGVKQVYYAGAAYNEERTNIIAEMAGLTMTRIPGLISYGQ